MSQTQTQPKQWSKENTSVMRVHKKTYKRLATLRIRYGKALGKNKASFAELLDECAKLAELFLDGEEMYFANGKLTHDVAEAWGHAVQESVRTGEAKEPLVLLKIGKDDRFHILAVPKK